ncbi:MAG: hypothetical protein ABL858_09310 [Candidatus Nitrotoga sp.]
MAIPVEGLSYAVIQVVHNFGAAAIVGGAVFALFPATQPVLIQRSLAWLVISGWTIQGLSGMVFGATSFYFYGKLPDIHGIAAAALIIKVICAAIGFGTAALYLLYGQNWSVEKRRTAWVLLIALGVIALTAAAFLRWLS